MKKTAMILAAVLTVSAVLPAVPAGIYDTAYAASEEESITGTYGDNITWEYTPDRRLIIRGEGAMPEVSGKNIPEWWKFNDGLRAVIIEEGITEICPTAFSGFDNLSSVSLPDSLTRIGDAAFSDCSKITAINIPDKVEYIGNVAFMNCSLESLTLPEGLKTIGYMAFQRGGRFSNVEIPGSVTELGGMAFANTGLRTVTIPDTITSLSCAFSNTAIEKIDFPESIECINDTEFEGCENLTEITIPDGIPSIGTAAFWGCKALETVEIPDTVKSIGGMAFYGCTSLKNVTIPASVEIIDPDGERADKPGSVFPPETIITGYAGTEAERYAKEWGLKFITLEKESGDPESKVKKNYTYYSTLRDGEVIREYKAYRESVGIPVTDKEISQAVWYAANNKWETGKRSPLKEIKNGKISDIGFTEEEAEAIASQTGEYFGFDDLLAEGDIAWEMEQDKNYMVFDLSLPEQFKDALAKEVLCEYMRRDMAMANSQFVKDSCPDGYVYTLGSATCDESELPTAGDANQDGEVTLADALIILQYVANEEKYPLTESGKKAADCFNTGDGITAMDTIAVLRLDTGKIESLPTFE